MMLNSKYNSPNSPLELENQQNRNTVLNKYLFILKYKFFIWLGLHVCFYCYSSPIVHDFIKSQLKDQMKRF